MSIEQTDKVDFIDKASGAVWLTIRDHLPWNKQDSEHLLLLQRKLNAYFEIYRKRELFEKYPELKGPEVGIDYAAKYPLSKEGARFFDMAADSITQAGFSLRCTLLQIS